MVDAVDPFPDVLRTFFEHFVGDEFFRSIGFLLRYKPICVKPALPSESRNPAVR